MPNHDNKHSIATALQSFVDGRLTDHTISLFQTLGYNTARQAPFSKPTYKEFYESYASSSDRFREDKALVDDWNYVDLLFQLSKDELSEQLGIFNTDRVDNTVIESYLFFVIGLSGFQYSRTALSQITREVNKLFPMPVMILFKHGKALTLAVIDRRLHKKDVQKDVLEKVTLIKDIQIEDPHRAHLEILADLSLENLVKQHAITNYVELHNAWQKTLDIKELNKRFYNDLSNWYFWAMQEVSYPDDLEKSQEVRNATNLIRLITRIIFIWFVKEKDLVPQELFQQSVLKKILKDFCNNNHSHSYYQAILQNLFFGILNQKMDERGFAQNQGYPKNKNQYGVKNLLRYNDLFLISEAEVLELFKDIPFLNGGLFDCLDTPDESGKILYVDGFSRNPKKQAIVPDYLFFGAERDVDLNEIYGTKNKKYKTKGLIEILASYKFTITENTPIEEEVALDPELLGKVFENLLASYNPETKTTARKQTGSFYTPREIVNYMVDESLIAYLTKKLDEGGYPDREQELRVLLSYTDKPSPFNQKETAVLIKAIDECKILDPACGSGAFPMGILHKLVHILHTIDPQNKLWKDRQIEKAHALDEPVIQEKLIRDIEEAFEYNELDYGRKLYLIENCIYGVDIQPIAVQIAKLRFFIALVIDQQKQPGRENLGIQALPNLETKFVAANTLIPLEKPEGQLSLFTFKNPEIESLEEKLKQLRHCYFNAKTRRDKLNYQNQDEATREQLSKLLIISGWSEHTAMQMAGFDPYNQNSSALFFDSEWMFGIKDGFDIVIGNPPYLSALDFSKIYSKTFRLQLNKIYESASGTYDYYVIFIEKGLKLCKDQSHLILITPNKYLSANYAVGIRKFIVSNAKVIHILDVSSLEVFDQVSVYPIISLFQRKMQESNTISVSLPLRRETKRFELSEYYNQMIPSRYLTLLPEYIWGFLLSNCGEIDLQKIINNTQPLSDFGEINATTTAAESDLYGSMLTSNYDETYMKVINTGTIGRYKTLWGKNEMIHGGHKYLKPYLPIGSKINARRITIYKAPKVIYSKIAKTCKAFIDVHGEYASLNTNCFYSSKDSSSIKYIGAICNSKMFMYLYSIFFSALRMSGGYYQFQAPQLRVVPVPFTDANNLEAIEALVDNIIFLKARNKNTTSLEEEIDQIVYSLYGLSSQEIEFIEKGL